MAYTDEQVFQWFLDNPNATDAQIAQTAAAAGISAEQLSRVTSVPVAQIQSRVETAVPGLQLPPASAPAASAATQNTQKIEGLPTNPYDPSSAKLAYNQGAYTYNGHYGQPVWENGEIIGYDFMQHDVTPGMMSNIKTDLQGNVISRAVTPEGESITFSDALKMAAPFALAAFPGLGAALGGSLGLSGTAANVVGGGLLGGATSAATGGDFVKGALTGGLGAYAGSVAGGGSGSLGPQTDASFLAADAAQLAAQGLSEAQIASTLGSYGSTAAANLAASMAVNGLDVGTMTTQLDNLSTNTGLMSQTGSSADFLAADALQLQGQVGNNFAAIEQNLIASGVDPLIAADVSQQIAFNPGITQPELATNLSNSFGNNIYDVNMAQTYPTSVLPGAGGLLSDVAGSNTGAGSDTGAGNGAWLGDTETVNASTAASTGAGNGAWLGDTETVNATTAAAAAGSGLTQAQIANLVKAGISLGGLTAGVGAVANQGSPSKPFVAPTQQMPAYTSDYYNQLQQYYNAYLPQTPKDVVAPLQQWYNSSYGA
jgi:hypothetical protein